MASVYTEKFEMPDPGSQGATGGPFKLDSYCGIRIQVASDAPFLHGAIYVVEARLTTDVPEDAWVELFQITRPGIYDVGNVVMGRARVLQSFRGDSPPTVNGWLYALPVPMR